jgi:ABC-type uncharacterized transport system substrate-binding protein
VQFDQLKRREFITLLGGAATWPLAARAQQPDRMRRVGVLMSYPESNSEGQSDVAAFRQGLQKLGWTEGGNIRIDTRWATPNDVESIRRFAKQLVAMKPDVILTHNTPTTASVLEQTHAIPVIFAIVVDPVGSGFVASLARPGGNATGFMNFEPSMGGKWLELLKEIAPRVARVAFLFNPTTAPYADFFLTPFKTVAASFAVEAIPAPIHDMSDLESVLAAHAREPNGAFINMPDSFLLAHRAEITSLAAHYRLPAVHWHRHFPEFDGLLSYEMSGLIIIGAQQCMLIASSRAQIRGNCQSNSRPNLNWSSI